MIDLYNCTNYYNKHNIYINYVFINLKYKYSEVK